MTTAITPTQPKTFILDTNVLLSTPNALFGFADNNIILPLIVIEELDKQKDRQDDAGLCARTAARTLSELIKANEKKDIRNGLSLGKGYGTLKILSSTDVHVSDVEIPSELKENYADNKILAFCLAFKKQHPRTKMALVSRDILLRVKAEMFDIDAQDFRKFNAAPTVSDMYTGIKHLDIPDFDFKNFYAGENVCLAPDLIENNGILTNQFVIIKSESCSAMARYMGPDRALKRIPDKMTVGKIEARNKEQKFALDLLMDPSIKLVSLTGLSGSGKSLLSIVAGLEQVIGAKKLYESLLICKPIVPVGRELGFTPGPQPLSAKILTPNGWTTMGQLKIGDKIISRDGKPTNVIGIYPKGIKPVYKITTTEETSTECCEDHLWLTQTAENRKRSKPGEIKTTKQIKETLTKKIPWRNNREVYNHFLPRNEAVNFNKKELPLPPYVLGVILGDGHIGDSISFASIDKEIINRVEKEIKTLNCFLTHNEKNITHNFRSNLFNNKTARLVQTTNLITGEKRIYNSIGEYKKEIKNFKSTVGFWCETKAIKNNLQHEFLPHDKTWQNPIKNILSKLKLEGTRAHTKFIPEEYLYSSIEDRVALLQGLMDTDGTIKKSGEASFTTVSFQLAKDIANLVQSLGGRAVIHKRDRVGKLNIINGHLSTTRYPSYEFDISLPTNINPFSLSRKASRHHHEYSQGIGIKSIEYVGEREVQCILVDNPEHLYITDDYIVTHNTVQEKLEPWISSIKDTLRFLYSNSKKTREGEDSLAYLFDRGIIEIEAMPYIRGRSIANAFMIITESQNLTVHEIKTIITRVGEGTKIIIEGDINQSDCFYLDSVSNGLSVAIEKFKGHNLSGHVTLNSGCRSTIATYASVTL